VQPGDELAGRYLLEERLGRGGMGEVWRAVDQRLHRPVAVKVLSNLRQSSPFSSLETERFRREALTTAGPQRPGIAVVHDADQHGDQWFIVMEPLHGQDLAAAPAARPDRRLKIDQVISLLFTDSARGIPSAAFMKRNDPFGRHSTNPSHGGDPDRVKRPTAGRWARACQVGV
jgi:serine/threonine protein kinase